MFFELLKKGYSCVCDNNQIIYKFGRVKTRKIILKKDSTESLTSAFMKSGVVDKEKQFKLAQNLVSSFSDIAKRRPLDALKSCPLSLYSISDVATSIGEGLRKIVVPDNDFLDILLTQSAQSENFETTRSEFQEDKELRAKLQLI